MNSMLMILKYSNNNYLKDILQKPSVTQLCTNSYNYFNKYKLYLLFIIDVNMFQIAEFKAVDLVSGSCWVDPLSGSIVALWRVFKLMLAL